MNREGYTGYSRGEARNVTAGSLNFDSRNTLGGFTRLPWGVILLITAIALTGAAMLYSAAHDPILGATAGAEANLWRSHLSRFGISFLLMIGLALLPLGFWARIAYPAYLVTLVLLLLVELFGVVGGGAQRWVQIGPVALQPSEFAKIAVTLTLARYYQAMLTDGADNLLVHLGALGLILVPASLVFIQPDLGTTLALVASGLVIIFFAGLSLRIISAVIVAGIAAVPAIYYFVLEAYQRERVDTFLAGLTGTTTNGLAESYQIEQAKIAIGAGGASGRGFLQGIQSQQDYVPEQHTDFILTIIAEEFGFIGSLVLLSVFGFLLAWSFYTAFQCKGWFGRFAAIGAASTISFYVIFNVAMVIGLLPVVGMPLPLLSYGGTAMITVMACFGLILSVYLHRDEKVTATGLI